MNSRTVDWLQEKMSFLLEEISNLKRARSESQGANEGPKNKYVKRSQLEEKRIQEYEKAQAEREKKKKEVCYFHCILFDLFSYNSEF